MLNINAEFLRAELSHFQLAKDNTWEQALRFDLSVSPKDVYDRLGVLQADSNDLAVEAFFKASDDDEVFIGISLRTLPAAVQLDFGTELVGGAPKGSTLRSLVQSINRYFGTISLFGGMPSHAEAGIINSWRSIGAERVWEYGMGSILTPEALRARADQLFVAHATSAGLEFVWQNPYPHWIGFSFAAKVNEGRYLADAEKYRKITSMLAVDQQAAL